MTPRQLLHLNAITTGASAIAMLLARPLLYPLFGLASPTLLDIIAVGLLAYAAALVATARRPEIGPVPLIAFTIGDGLWVASSALVLVLFWTELTPLARALVIVTAVVVDVFAMLQFRAAQRLTTRAA